MVRCKNIPQNRAVKMNVGEGGDHINLNNAEHVAKLRRFFKAANDNRMPIVIHLGSAGNYGRREVRIFLNEIVSAAPDIPIQIAHMSSAFESPEALSEFADARAGHNPLTKNLYFDLSVGRFAELPSKTGQFLAEAIRKIALEHVLYASDELPGDHHPPTRQHWEEMRRNLPLTNDEFKTIADNIAPYMVEK
jgi:predicted TIM-barrel fold metal-dependent hydrolase